MGFAYSRYLMFTTTPMASRCQRCATLSIRDLFDSDEEFGVAWESSYESLDDLKRLASRGGCDLCALILECFEETPSYEDWKRRMEPIAPRINVKLLIEDSHAKNRGGLGAHVVHTLGMQFKSGTDDGRHEWSSALEVPLTTPREEEIYVGKYRIGRFHTDPDLGSWSNHDIARAWLKDCQENHADCLRRDDPPLPTRVIDVGTGGNANTIRIVHSQGKAAQYVTLSHCWGGSISPVLTTKALEKFGKGLSLRDLPANFRDAVVITRELGIRYLWIDCLCIVQDSKSDWEQEFKKMGQFYSNSTLTVYALTSEKSTNGILRRGPKPRSVRLDVHPGGDQDRQVIQQSFISKLTNLFGTLGSFAMGSEVQGGGILMEKFDQEESLGGLHRGSPLVSRGWTLQESLLSPRQLFYGSRQIYWKCPQGFESGDGLAQGGRTPDKKYPEISSLLFRDSLAKLPTCPVETRRLLREYYEIVQAYSSRNLTYDSDRLPAFSGVAQRIHTAIPGEYLAGLWSHDFPRGLDWTAPWSRTRSPSYHAPSWSWVAANAPIRYIHGRKLRSDKFRLQLREHDIGLSDASNPYGQVKSGHVVVQGYTSPLFLHYIEMFKENRTHDIDSWAEFDTVDHGPGWVRGTIEGNNSLQCFNGEASESKRYLVLVLGRWCKDKDDGTDEEDTSGVGGIILCRVTDGKENEFQRVGYADLGVSQAWLEKCDYQELKLL